MDCISDQMKESVACIVTMVDKRLFWGRFCLLHEMNTVGFFKTMLLVFKRGCMDRMEVPEH